MRGRLCRTIPETPKKQIEFQRNMKRYEILEKIYDSIPEQGVHPYRYAKANGTNVSSLGASFENWGLLVYEENDRWFKFKKVPR